MQRFDVAIVGAGMTGLTLALSLVKLCDENPLKIVLIDAGENHFVESDTPSLRVSAINLASQRVFENLGIWQQVINYRSQAYQSMQVWEQDSFARIEFAHHQLKHPHLGTIVENDVLRHALWQQAEQHSHIEIISSQKIRQFDSSEHEVYVSLENGDNLTCKLIVGADGANSWLRQQANLPLTFKDYGHQAIVATIKTQLPHNNNARQVFSPRGPLALLPLWKSDLCSIVWSQTSEHAQRLLSLSDNEFNQELSASFDMQAGLCEVQSERVSFPLTMRYVRRWSKERLTLIGDAAHTIHPLAGQGANLGFMDAAALAEVVANAHQTGKDIGQLSLLRGYERWRKTEAAKMIAAMQGFKGLFGNADPILKTLRGVGMRLTYHLPMLKQPFMQQAAGLDGELPGLARPASIVS
ncbi:FAD-dependent monooxygenase [Neptunicella marina]|uniref:FAD-dependent monooxygenase n=1 Tax=Neptunicella marina TaxID=2125989 RepID=A0A8J6IWM7_9ALTE|nr:FAD-dependent monooxygenase [Neptunicella marina]MBC3766856.1 FAD-dependent monooxygenase [Neptunicella marina]